MLRAVLDTNVLVAALRSRRGASFRVLASLGEARWEPVVSVALVLEYEAAGRDALTQIGLPVQIVDDIIDMICATARQQTVRFRLRPVLTDPNDEFVLELAVASEADCIVTNNLKDFAGAGRFGVAVMTPAEFLRKIEGEP